MNPAKAFPPTVPPSDDEFGPITPRVVRPSTLPNTKSYRSPQDCEQTSVFAELWDADGGIMLKWHFVVAHEGAQVVSVQFPPGWHRMAMAIGLDPDDSDAQGYLVTEAKRAFARRAVGEWSAR